MNLTSSISLKLIQFASLTTQTERDQELAKNVRDGFNQVWDVAINPTNPLYQHLTGIGMTLGFVTASMLLVRWGRDLLDKGTLTQDFAEILWPVIVIAFLANHGAAIAGMTKGLRNYVNTVEVAILKEAKTSISGYENINGTFAEIIGGALNIANIPTMIGAKLASCRSSDSPIDCLAGKKNYTTQEDGRKVFASWVDKSGAIYEAIQDLKQMEDARPNMMAKGTITRYKEELGELLVKLRDSVEPRGTSSATPEDPNELPTEVIKLMAASEQSGMLKFFTGSATAFLWMIELVTLLMGLLAPLAVGLSLLPVGTKAIFAWVSGFFSLAFTKIFYFVLTGLASIVILRAASGFSISNFTDTIFISMFIGIFAPLLSLAVLVSGGRAIFQSLTSYVGTGLDRLSIYNR